MYNTHDNSNKHHIAENESPCMFAEQKIIDQQEIVDIKYQHEGDRCNLTMNIFCSCHLLLFASGKEERDSEDNHPSNNMDDVLHSFIGRTRKMYGCIFCHIKLCLINNCFSEKADCLSFDKQSVVKVNGETSDHETSYILLNIIHNE